MMNKSFIGQKCVQGYQNIQQRYTSNFTQERFSKKFYFELLTENVTLFLSQIKSANWLSITTNVYFITFYVPPLPCVISNQPPLTIHSWRVAYLWKLTYTDAVWHYTIYSTLQNTYVRSHHITKQKNVFLLNISAWKGLILPAFCILVSRSSLFIWGRNWICPSDVTINQQLSPTLYYSLLWIKCKH